MYGETNRALCPKAPNSLKCFDQTYLNLQGFENLEGLDGKHYIRTPFFDILTEYQFYKLELKKRCIIPLLCQEI
jgi:hypothetical protein